MKMQMGYLLVYSFPPKHYVMKAHILIVEDEAILYERLRRLLIKENYSVSDYIPSVVEAREAIAIKRPDLVVLDIELAGAETGLDLGKELSQHYQIPFIYLTNLDDHETFYKGLNTQHESFLLKTKPRLDATAVIRAIQTALHKTDKQPLTTSKEGVLGLVGYLEDLKSYTGTQITKVPVAFTDIVFFSKKTFVNENDAAEELRTNYIWFKTRRLLFSENILTCLNP